MSQPTKPENVNIPTLPDGALGDWISNAKPEEYRNDPDKEWLKRIVFGKPRNSKKHSVAELEAMGLVGVYFPKK
jgi:hypothetical protein